MALCLWGILTISPIRVPVINLLSAMITEVEAEDRIHNMIIAWFELKIKEKQRFFMLQYIPCILWLESRRTIKFEIAAISKSGFENPYFLWEIIILFRCPIIR